MLKKIICVVTVIMILASITVFSADADTYYGYNVPVDIDINGDLIKCEQKPILIDSVTYIPLRAFSDAIGGVIEWVEAEDAAKLTKDGHTFVFYPGRNYSVIDDVKTEYVSVFYKDLTFIPVRVVSEVLNYDVLWDGFYLTVKITAPEIEIKEESKDNTYTHDDVLYLGKIIQIEGGYQPFNTKLGIAGTIINRVKSSKFPNSVKDVIFDTKYGVQFPPMHTDKINVTPSKESIIAAKCALGGVNIIGNSLYFIDKKSAPSSWAHKNRQFYANVGDMSFYL